jgi:hypothetical protein
MYEWPTTPKVFLDTIAVREDLSVGRFGLTRVTNGRFAVE